MSQNLSVITVLKELILIDFFSLFRASRRPGIRVWALIILERHVHHFDLLFILIKTL
jgi:hypothetical protein